MATVATEVVVYKRIIPAVLLIAVVSIVVFALSFARAKEPPKPQTISYRQIDGQTVAVKLKPQRVVVGYGSLAKVWDLAGGRAIAVPGGLLSRDALPESMRNLPACGSPQAPNVEAIAAMQPDLVLLTGHLQRHRDGAEILRGMGIDAVCVNYDNYRDFNDLLDFFCRINGRKLDDVPEAKKVISDVRSVCEKLKGRPAPRCAIFFASASGFSLETGGTNSGIVLEMLGGKNILESRDSRRIKFSYEQLMLEDPDVIFVVTMGKAPALKKKFEKEFASQPAWKMLKAAKNNRVHFLPPPLFLYMAGPDYPEAFRHMANLLYPDME